MKIKKLSCVVIMFFVMVLAVVFFQPIKIYANNNASTESINYYLQNYYLTDQDNLKNRTAGGLGEQNMAEQLVLYCQTEGFDFAFDYASYVQEFPISTTKSSQNILAQKGNSATQYVILGAHYDAVYVENKSFGYNDNLSGVLAVMETARVLSATSDYNIIIAFWGAEEIGRKGSQYFVDNLSKQIKDNILLYINFDSVGAGDHLYYYSNDFQTTYGNYIDNKMSDKGINKYQNQLYSSHTTNGINYTSLALQSDNATFLKSGINSLSYFSGNLDTANGLGYFETACHPKIMHVTDTKQTIDFVFGEEKFAENILEFVNVTAGLLQDLNFLSAVFPGQVDAGLFSDVTLKICGVLFVVLGFGGYILVYFLKYKRQ